MKRTLTCVLVIFLLLLGTHLSSQAQTRAVTGKVTNDKNEPLSGASVVVKNRPSTGTITNESGSFTLNVAASDDSLIISAIGFERLTVAISNDIQARLSAGRGQLDEVVVVGYGTQKRADLT